MVTCNLARAYISDQTILFLFAGREQRADDPDPCYRARMRLKQPKNTQIAGTEPRPKQDIPTEAAKISARMIRASPKPHEELRLGRSKGLIGTKALHPRRGAGK